MGEVWFEGSILFLLLLAALPALAALAIILDRKSRRGYGLALLSAAALTLDVWGIISLSLAAQQFNADSEKLLFDLMVAEYFLIGLYIAFVLIVGGIVETAIACQWWWLALFAALSFIPAVIILAPRIELAPDVFGAFGLSQHGEAIILLLLPALVTFAYAIVRTFRPVIPRGPRGIQDAAIDTRA